MRVDVGKRPKKKKETSGQGGAVPPSAPSTGSLGAPALPLPEGERVSEPVKLRPTFKERLQRVARDAGVEMGVLIEQRMADFINREYRRLLQEDLERLQAEDN